MWLVSHAMPHSCSLRKDETDRLRAEVDKVPQRCHLPVGPALTIYACTAKVLRTCHNIHACLLKKTRTSERARRPGHPCFCLCAFYDNLFVLPQAMHTAHSDHSTMLNNLPSPNGTQIITVMQFDKPSRQGRVRF